MTTAGRRTIASTGDAGPGARRADRGGRRGAASGIEVALADSLELQQQVLEVVDRIWRPPPGEPVITLGVLRAMVHAGNYCSAALLDGRLVGVCLGFLGDHPPPVPALAHRRGHPSRAAGRHIGYALKLHQRAWALDRGLDTVTWTFDPLVRRNAYFNTVKLAARPVEYLVDFYGEMTDEINVGQGSDRLLVDGRCWRPTWSTPPRGTSRNRRSTRCGSTPCRYSTTAAPDGPITLPDADRCAAGAGPGAAGHRAAAARCALSWESRWRAAVRGGHGRPTGPAVGPSAAAPATAGTCWCRRVRCGVAARVAVTVTHGRRVEPPAAARTGRPRGGGARMTESSRTSLRRVLDDLGRTVLEVVAGPAGAAAVDGPAGRVGGVVILDPLDPPLLPPRAIVLAVGVAGAGPLADAARRARRPGCGGPGGAGTGGRRRPGQGGGRAGRDRAARTDQGCGLDPGRRHAPVADRGGRGAGDVRRHHRRYPVGRPVRVWPTR